MKRFFRTTLVGITTLFLLLTGSVPVVRADEIDVLGQTQQILNQTGTGITVNDILKASGLDNAEIRKICVAGNILKRVGGIIKNFGSILKNELAAIMNDMFSLIRGRIIDCAISNALGSIPVIGGLAGVRGGTCVKVTNSDVGGILKHRWELDFKQSFIASCGAAVAMDGIGNQIDAMLKSQGPDGGPAWVTDYVETLNRMPDQYARRRFWTILVNTDICGYFKEDILDYFSVPNNYRKQPPALGAGGFAVSGNAPFNLRASCTLPKNFDPDDTEALLVIGGFDALRVMAQPQNNSGGFISMAQTELISQQAAMRSSLYAQVIGGGGFLPTVSQDCQKDPEGKCITEGTIENPSGGVRDIKSNFDLTELQKIANTNGEQNKALTDIATKIKLRLLSLANQPLPFQIEFGPEYDSSNYESLYTPLPADLVCTGGNPDCTCVTDNADAQFASQTAILQATNTAAQQHPELLTPDGTSILPGQNYPFLQAVCAAGQLAGGNCSPNPNSTTEIILGAPAANVSFEVLAPDNVIRRPGKPIAFCQTVL